MSQLNRAPDGGIFWAHKYKDCKFKTKEQEILQIDFQRYQVLGCLAGCLELIAFVLKIKNTIDSGAESSYELVGSIKFFGELVTLLTDKSELYHFKTPLPIYSLEKETTSSTLGILQGVTATFESNEPTFPVNIIQVLASYLNL